MLFRAQRHDPDGFALTSHMRDAQLLRFLILAIAAIFQAQALLIAEKPMSASANVDAAAPSCVV